MAPGPPLVIAHRGGIGPWPENTVGSFLHGLTLGADGVELDVHLSADGAVVVHHDDALGRVFAGDCQVRDCTLAELRAAVPVVAPGTTDAVGGQSAADVTPDAFSRIPTLDEVLTAISGRGPAPVHVNVELKTDTFFYPGIEEQVAAILVRYASLSFVVSSFNPDSLGRFRAVCPDVPTAFLDHRPASETVATALRIGAAGIHPNFRGLTQVAVAEARAAGLAVRPYTVNDPNAMHRLAVWRVEALITDDVASARVVTVRL